MEDFKEYIVKLVYKWICKFYQFNSTLYENIALRHSKPRKEMLRKGYLKYENNYLTTYNFKNISPTIVNKYLSLRILDESEIKQLISQIFNENFIEYVELKTGFRYSIDFFIAYDRKYIPKCDRDVKTLDQWYSYRWHYDKPNSNNMLKVVIPLNIEIDEDGPLTLVERKESKKIKDMNSLDKFKNHNHVSFKGLGNNIYAFNPTVCIHKDGIPSAEKISTQIMFQLNPAREWEVNSRLINHNSRINNKLDIWTTEPKFPLLAYRSDKKINLRSYRINRI